MKSKFFKNNNLILICGPTAVGKSDLASQIAKTIDGEIINADSMQVYKYFNILTSQPSIQQKKNANHHLYSYVDVNKKFSAAQWLKDANIAIEKILKKEKTPIVVGGSGLYTEFLLNGINLIPKVSSEVRKKIEQDINKYGLEFLYSKLLKIDPKYATKISSNDRQRIVRSLEVYYQTKSKFSDFHSKKKIKTRYNFFKVLLMPDRKLIRKNCATRFEKMIANGLIDEVAQYRKLVSNSNISNAIGYSEICAFLNKEMSLKEAKNLAITKTRRYSKRQSTWFRNRLKIDVLLNSREDTSLVVESFSKII